MPAQFDGCDVVRKLQAGPAADLYQAVQHSLNRPVFIKTLSETILSDSPFAAALEREARVLAELSHPNILHIYDFVRQSERIWLVLEYVDGFTLDEILTKVTRLPADAATAIAICIARALDHAHGRQIVHRDIQPRNILISRTGDVKLINFTASVDERMTTAPELLDGTTSFGAPAYMSPEQILGEPADPRSDLFSLGVVFYQMLSGDRPFDAPDQRSATQRIRHEPPPPLGRRLPGINPGVERSIVRCLQKMPADRFESAEELTQALVAAAWELGITTHRGAITSALHAARFIDQVPAEAGELAQRSTLASAAPTAKRALIGLLAASIAIVAGGTVIHAMASRTDAAAGRVPAYLELAPPDPAYLRIVADPWAHVTVDGEAVDTTPLARPLPLKAGIHHIRLEHPNAPPERRTVKLTAGETVLLDVKMQVRAANRPVVAPAAQVEEVDPDPSP